MGGIGDFLFGSPDKLKKVPTGTKQQTQFGGTDLINLLQQMMQQGGGLDLANKYDQSLLGNGPEAFNQFSSPYLKQFEEEILPQIAERFAGMGALSSSGFGQSLGGSASSLQSNLAQLFAQLQGQAAGRQQGQFGNLSQLGLNYSPFSYEKQKGSSGVFAPLATAAGTALGGPLGGAVASGISSLFKKGEGGENQFPLTGMYDSLFRSGAII
jgi:hypothetical protein